jgi:hypothetical protein
MITIPFDFGDMDSTEEFQIEIPEERAQRIFAPGTYEVRVSAVSLKGAMAKDPTWMQLKFVLETVDGKSTEASIFVPTKTLAYGQSQGIAMMWKNTTRPFLAALGLHADRLVGGRDVTRALSVFFGNPELLVGCYMKVKLGYDKNYTKKDTDGKIKVFSPDGVLVPGYPVWDDYAAQKAYSEQTGLKFAYLQPQTFEAMVSSPNVDTLKRISNGRVDDMIRMPDNCPF